MRRSLSLSIAACAAVLALPESALGAAPQGIVLAQAGGMDRQTASKIAKAEQLIDRLERAIEQYEEAAPNAAERRGNTAAKALEKAEAALEEIQGTPDHRALSARLSALRTRYETKKSAFDADAASAAADLAKLEAMKASGELAQDEKALQSLHQALADPGRYNTGNGVYTAYGSPESLETVIWDSANWNENLAAFEALAAKYDALGTAPLRGAASLAFSIRQIRQTLPETQTMMVGFKSDAPGLIESTMDDAIATAEAAIRDSNFRAFTGTNAKMRLALIKPEALTRVYEALPIVSRPEASSVRALFEKKLSVIEEHKASARDKIIAENRLETHVYQGADRKAVEAMALKGFEAIHGKQNILEMRIPASEWTRRQGWRYSRTNEAYEYFDYSTINVFVVEKSSPTIATIWLITVHKKHQEGDALISDPASRTRHDPSPDQQVLIANL